jgi:prepilin-type N-terminal cleavage/methylation domain-containing protein
MKVMNYGKRKTKFPNFTPCNFSKKGFTLVEVVVAFAIVVFVAAIGIPLGINSYRHYILTSETRNLLSLFRRAQALAMANAEGGSFGIKLQNDRFTLFRGSNFENRNAIFDEDYLRSKSVTVTGFDEIVFSPLSGSPQVTSTVFLSNGPRTMEISINSHGTIIW